MPQVYNSPSTTPSGTSSSIGPQFNTHHYDRKALIDALSEIYFMPLADSRTMPRNYGKEIKAYHYIPLLDDRNVNDQGIDANGTTTAHGNLYGSSKDIGVISQRLAVLGEEGGRVNRVGFTRIDLTGEIKLRGIFMEFTDEMLMFDTDKDLYSHMSRLLVEAIAQKYEAELQMDIINAAGTVMYAGEASADDEITGEGNNPSVVSYDNLRRLNRILNDNKTPKHTTIISGSRLVDTRVVNSARIMYIGSALESTVQDMVNARGEPVFKSVETYADAGNILNGEIGAIDQFRIVVVPEMLHAGGEGAAATNSGDWGVTSNNYDVHHMVVVGNESFATVGLQGSGTSGDKAKYKIIVKMPGRETAISSTDPYGKTGFSSIQYWYGFMALRPERLAVIKTVGQT